MAPRTKKPKFKMIPNYPLKDQCVVVQPQSEKLGRPCYIIITRDRSAWNPETEKWVSTNQWPRVAVWDKVLRYKLVYSVATAWNKHFSTETITAVPVQDKRCLDCCGFPSYWITRDGRVWSDITYAWLTPSANNSRRGTGRALHVSLCKNGHAARAAVHSLVAETFRLPNPHNYPFVKHKDKDYTNCAYDNLVWSATPTGGPNVQVDDTPSEEEAAFIKNLVAKIKPVNGVIPDPTAGTIIAIIELRKAHWTPMRLSKATGLSRMTINDFFRMYAAIDYRVKLALK